MSKAGTQGTESMIGRWIGDERGASAIEYALILALVPMVAIAALDTLGGMQRPLGEVASTLNESGPETLPRATAGVAGVETAADSQPWLSDAPSLRLPLVGVTAASLVVGLVLLRRRRRRDNLLNVSPEDVVPCPLQSERVALKRQQILRQLSHDVQLVLNNRVEVRQVMTTDPTIVLPTMLVDALTPIMIERRTRHLPVCDADGQLLGVISDRDVLARNGRRAADIMTRVVASVSPTSPLAPAVTLMLNRQISCLPVVEEGRLVGIITTSDVLMTLQCALHLLARGDGQLEWRTGTSISELCDGSRPEEPVEA